MVYSDTIEIIDGVKVVIKTAKQKRREADKINRDRKKDDPEYKEKQCEKQRKYAERHKEKIKEMKQTEEYKERRKVINWKYDNSEKGKATEKAYHQSPAGKKSEIRKVKFLEKDWCNM